MSLKRALVLIRRIFDASDSKPWRTQVLVHLRKCPNYRMLGNEMLEVLADVFKQDWASFQEALQDEKKKWASSQEAPQDEKKSAEDDKQKDDSPEDEKLKAEYDERLKVVEHEKLKADKKKQDGLAAARKKAKSLYTSPGCVILTPQNWQCASLEKMLKAQVAKEDQGAFVAFFFAGSDRAACVHPNQNTCLRQAPLKKSRLSSFCHAVNSIMVESRDAVVIGVGRVDGNQQVVEQVVAEMKWEHRAIVSVMARAEYDNFIQSGSPTKKRRVHRGLGTTRYSESYWICWKARKKTDTNIHNQFQAGGLPIKSGVRKFVDKGSLISSDMLMECPQVALGDIYTVPVLERKEALGEGGQETQKEAESNKKTNTQDPTLPAPTIRK